jgi:hypothetical protein
MTGCSQPALDAPGSPRCARIAGASAVHRLPRIATGARHLTARLIACFVQRSSFSSGFTLRHPACRLPVGRCAIAAVLVRPFRGFALSILDGRPMLARSLSPAPAGTWEAATA